MSRLLQAASPGIEGVRGAVPLLVPPLTEVGRSQYGDKPVSRDPTRRSKVGRDDERPRLSCHNGSGEIPHTMLT